MFKPSGVFNAVSLKTVQPPTVFVTPLALFKMQTYVDKCDMEIGWLGIVEKCENNTYVIMDTLLFKQEVHATTTEINEQNLMEVAEEILSRPNGVELYNKIKMWGHSHVNMGVTPSGQDDLQIESFGANNDYFIRIIANKKREMKVDLYDWVNGMKYLALDWNVLWTTDVGVDIIEKEMKEKVTKKQTTYFNTGYYGKQIKQPSKNSNWGYEAYENYDFYDGYERLPNKIKSTSKKKVKMDVSVSNIIHKASDLFDVLGLEEQDVIDIDELVTMADAKDLIEEFLMMEVNFADVAVIQKYAREYVEGVYGQ